ncbi:DUF58 domain-containing protein [Lignipirellula cremea]|uniref:DUF58 domain-containing protein n=1 Tax=Lignipirellula cremea TaxID=2528010 RepID=A0A518E2S2_9BACT|nr:DUF58 domain-containing protein [Lignipirellula cremea]QDU98387.1 hypothetical protein Pla8534_62550 [Lignipirellula cremea]
MSTFPSNFLAQCGGLQHEARRSWGGRFLGREVERRLAGGTEVTGYCDYTSGDDFRHVDWNRCARHDELLSKQYRGSASGQVYLLLDQSAGMRLGSPSKFDLARQVTAGLAYLALHGQERVQAGAWSQRLSPLSQPARGAGQTSALWKYLEALQPTDQPGDLPGAVRQFLDEPRRSGLVVLVSDFWSHDYRPVCDALRRRGMQTFLLQVVDREEIAPQFQGGVRFEDVALSQRWGARLTAVDLQRYRQVVAEHEEQLRQFCYRYRVGYGQIVNDQPATTALARLIRIGRARLSVRRG